MIQLIIIVIIILILLISTLIKEPFYGCDFIPWGNTHEDCTATCLNSKYKNLYSSGNPNCDTDDTCKNICEDCDDYNRCLWTTNDEQEISNSLNTCSLELDKTVTCNSVVITITPSSNSNSNSNKEGTYIIHYS